MQCPFCAETIRDGAVICRFCGSSRAGPDGEWRLPDRIGPTVAKSPAGGSFSLRFAGVFLVASAFMDLPGLVDAPVFGGLILVAVYLACGASLLALRPWGLPTFLVGTVVYSVERLLYLASDSAVEAGVADSLRAVEGLSELIDPATVSSVTRMTVLFSLAFWWILAFYVVRKRALFGHPRAGRGGK